MNTLAKWNSFRKSDGLEVWRPFARWDPFREMEDMMRNMQRTFPQWPARTEESMTLAEWSPSVDIGENDKEFIVKAELPDVKKEDIKVNAKSQRVTRYWAPILFPLDRDLQGPAMRPLFLACRALLAPCQNKSCSSTNSQQRGAEG